MRRSLPSPLRMGLVLVEPVTTEKYRYLSLSHMFVERQHGGSWKRKCKVQMEMVV
jgi:hypothetical protein